MTIEEVRNYVKPKNKKCFKDVIFDLYSNVGLIVGFIIFMFSIGILFGFITYSVVGFMQMKNKINNSIKSKKTNVIINDSCETGIKTETQQ